MYGWEDCTGNCALRQGTAPRALDLSVS